MNFIKKLILFLIILLSPLSVFACDVQNDGYTDKAVILSSNNFEKHYLKDNFNNPCINLIKTSKSSINSLRNRGVSGCADKITPLSKEKDYNLSDFYSALFLDNQSKTRISLLLFQIQPNAP